LTHDGLVADCAFNREGNLLVTCSWDLHARVWDFPSGKLLAKLPHGERVLTADFSPNSRLLVTGERLYRARLWEQHGTEWKWKEDLTNNFGEVSAVRFTPDGQKIVTGTAARVVQIFEAATGHLLREHS